MTVMGHRKNDIRRRRMEEGNKNTDPFQPARGRRSCSSVTGMRDKNTNPVQPAGRRNCSSVTVTRENKNPLPFQACREEEELL